MKGWQTRRANQSAPMPSAKNSTTTAATVQSVYEAASNTRRTLGWRAPTTSPNHALLASLHTLRDRSRGAVRNDGYAKGAIDKLVTNIVGTGIKPLSKAADAGMRDAVQKLWLKWTDESDADGLLDFYGQMAQHVRGWLEGGESYARLRPRLLTDGLAVPLQIQIIEPELCPHTHNAILPNGNKVRAGIEFNRIGKRVAYYFHPQRPGDLQDFDPGQLRRIPAERILPLFDPLRAGQLRGIPHLTQALIRLHELDKFDDATLLRQQLANLFVAFLTKEADDSDEEALHPLLGTSRTGEADDPTLTMEPGIFQELEPGQNVTFSDPPEIRQGYRDFMRQQLFAVSAATGVPYEILTGDMSGLNDRVVRVILNEFAGRIEAAQHQIVAFQFCRPVFKAFMDAAFFAGALPLPESYLTDPEPFAAVKFTPPRRRYIHPVQDVDAQEKAINAGFTSRSAVVSEWGEDAEVVDAEQAADNERADRLGLKYTSDAREPEAAPAAP
jgi:lambda family phage portal protein